MSAPLYITYCAADKDPAEEPMPAAWRYKSARIEAVLGLAVDRSVGFRILSGRYGLLAAGEPIPWYDHLLTAAEAPTHAVKVAQQLQDIAPTAVVFFMRSEDADSGVGPYLACCRAACRACALPLRVVELPGGAVDMAMLEMLV